MTDSLAFPDEPEEPVGVALARWRKRKQLSGQALGDRVGLSQATISRLENGRSPADPHVVRRVAEGLELPSDEVDRLVALAGNSDNQLTDWQTTEPNLSNRQHHVGRIESPAREVRIFQPAVVVGLLQTSEYARAILTGLRTGLEDDQGADSALAVSEGVAARMKRSQVLYEPNRTFSFVMSEAVLGNQVCRPADMLAQIARLREVAALPNVSLRIIPAEAELPLAPFHGFELVDDRYIFVDLFSPSLSSSSRHFIRQYRRVFDALESVATDRIEPLLDMYQRRYVRMLPGAVA
ncbi:helix-turn-helix domain-containing protein [Actinoplanes sp. URMC 104]|uniref:helix-turn-helix domain-containing protein n=1 Tax=Actinoplanes sp. URMC 104 TaxID=3423409 RepID=UPI003F1A0AC8